jgi:hypothetical protein
MPEFESMFMQSKGKPIEYNGRTLVMADRFPTPGIRAIRTVFEECNGRWRQGVRLKCNGEFRVDGQAIHGKGGFVLWHDTAPSSVEIELVGKVPEVTVYNVWDVGDGTIQVGHNGAAMIVEEIPNGRRYRCNDGEADDDFDDLIFRIEQVN